MASTTIRRWLRPESRLQCHASKATRLQHGASHLGWASNFVYPLFASVGVAVGICGLQLVRNITTNPDVRVSKVNRATAVLENVEEGKKYQQHFVRRFVSNKSTEIMPRLNSFFTSPNQ